MTDRRLRALLVLALVLPLAPGFAAVASARTLTDGDLFTPAAVAWFGEAPNGNRRLIAECHGRAPETAACERAFPSEFTYFWVSACRGSFETCDAFTGRVRVTYHDAETEDDVWTCDFLAGRHGGCVRESGTGYYRGLTTFRVEVLPVAGLPEPVGGWHVWVTSRK